MVWIDNIRVSAKLSLMVIAALIGLLLATGFTLKLARDHFVEERIEKIHAITEMLTGLARVLDKQAEDGQISRDLALQRFREVLNAERFEGGNYVSVIDFDGVSFANPGRPDFVGKSIIDLKDSDGVAFVRRIVDLGKGDGGALY